MSDSLPLNAEAHNGEVTLRPSGGLVTALAPVLRANGEHWVGWSGWTSDLDFTDPNYSFHAVSLSEADRVCYYQGFCNQII